MPEIFKIELTEDQVHMVAYALKEMGTKRAEQAIEWRQPELRTEAGLHFKLADTMYQSLVTQQINELIAPNPETGHKADQPSAGSAGAAKHWAQKQIPYLCPICRMNVTAHPSQAITAGNLIIKTHNDRNGRLCSGSRLLVPL